VTGRFETWLAGGKAAAKPAVDTDGVAAETDRYPGQRFDLPATGVGSVAGMGRRLAALFVDCVLATLITLLFVHIRPTDAHAVQTLNYWTLLTWFLITVVGTSWFGMTPGMVPLGVRVARLDSRPMLGPWRAIVRAVLVALIVPAVIWDIDRRGLHDKAVGTIVLAIR
jgi:uncharacterized RDD family membrane protein YckC